MLTFQEIMLINIHSSIHSIGLSVMIGLGLLWGSSLRGK